MIDPYEILGVCGDDSVEVIKAAYKRESRLNHPDKGGSEATFQMITEAWAILGDSEKRAHWDATGEAMPEAEVIPPEEAIFLRFLGQEIHQSPEMGDVLGNVKSALNKVLREARVDYDDTREAIECYRGQRGRFQKLGEGDNLIESTLASALQKLEGGLTDLSEKIRVHEKAIDVASGYCDTRHPVKRDEMTPFYSMRSKGDGMDWGVHAKSWSQEQSNFFRKHS